MVSEMTEKRKKPILKKETLRFETEIEKRIHKIISSARVGTTMNFDVDGDYDDFMYAIKKSVFYNNIDCKITSFKEKRKIQVKFDY